MFKILKSFPRKLFLSLKKVELSSEVVEMRPENRVTLVVLHLETMLFSVHRQLHSFCILTINKLFKALTTKPKNQINLLKGENVEVTLRLPIKSFINFFL